MRAARRSAVAAVASRDAARAESYAREWQIPVAHGSYDALLRDPGVDAVYVPLPNALHVEWTLRALDAGKHVLCEKPLALTPEDVDRVEAVARGRGLVVAEAFMYRHEPLIARVRELLRDGAIGRVRRVRAEFSYLQVRSPDVRLDPALGGGSLWDVGCYAVDAVRLVAGEEPVEALGVWVGAGRAVDMAFSGVLRFAHDVLGEIHSSFLSPYRTLLEVAGDAGLLRVENPFRPGLEEQIELRLSDESRRVRVAGSPLPFVRLLEDFAAAALDGADPVVPLRDSRGNAAALAALHVSARSRRPIPL